LSLKTKEVKVKFWSVMFKHRIALPKPSEEY